VQNITLNATSSTGLHFKTLCLSYNMHPDECFEMLVKNKKLKPSNKPIEFDTPELKCNDGGDLDLTIGKPVQCQCVNKNGERCKTKANLQKIRVANGTTNTIMYACSRHVNQAKGQLVRPHVSVDVRFGGTGPFDQPDAKHPTKFSTEGESMLTMFN